MNYLKNAMDIKPTPEEITAFRNDINTIIKDNVDSMIFRGAYDGLNRYLSTFQIHNELPTYVLEYFIQHTEKVKEHLPFRSVFISKAEDNAKERNEYTDGLFDQYK